jgi:hypothetical protein
MTQLSDYRFCHLALDLEGTLISNAGSQIPRPGLYRFLELCQIMFNEVVVFTTVPEPRFRDIAALLVHKGHAPLWLSWVRHMHCTDGEKDLSGVPRFGPQAMTLLVDDYADYVLPGAQSMWLPIARFAAPDPDDDAALEGLIQILARRVLAWRWTDDSVLAPASADVDAAAPFSEVWAPAALAPHQVTELLALLACASGLTASRDDALALMTHPWPDFDRRSFLDLVRAGRSEAAISYADTLTAGALG